MKAIYVKFNATQYKEKWKYQVNFYKDSLTGIISKSFTPLLH